jgi:hypothetical protein
MRGHDSPLLDVLTRSVTTEAHTDDPGISSPLGKPCVGYFSTRGESTTVTFWKWLALEPSLPRDHCGWRGAIRATRRG